MCGAILSLARTNSLIWQVSDGLFRAEVDKVCVPLRTLLRFEGGVVDEPRSGILYNFQDYLELLDWSGRIVRDDKRGFIDKGLPPILARLDIAPERWRINVTQFEFIHARCFNRLKSSFDTGQVTPIQLIQGKCFLP